MVLPYMTALNNGTRNVQPYFSFMLNLIDVPVCVYSVLIISPVTVDTAGPMLENRFSGVSIHVRHKLPVQSQKEASSVNIWISEGESENKGGYQLCSYCTADLRLCFHIGKIRFSHDAADPVKRV